MATAATIFGFQVNERRSDNSCNVAGFQPNVSSIIKVQQPTKPFPFFFSLSLFLSLSLSLSLFPSSSSSSLPSVFSPLSFFLSSLFRFFFVFFFFFYLGGDRHSAIISKLILTSIPVVTSFLAPFMCVFKSFNGV